jgi:hypothetical protein
MDAAMHSLIKAAQDLKKSLVIMRLPSHKTHRDTRTVDQFETQIIKKIELVWVALNQKIMNALIRQMIAVDHSQRI